MKKIFSLLTATLMSVLASFQAFAADGSTEGSKAELGDTLMLMLQGMLGIFVVMGLIYLVVFILNKVSAPKKDVKDDSK